jgi:ribosome-binding factor A
MLNNIRIMRLTNVLEKALYSIFMVQNMRYVDIKDIKLSKCLQYAMIQVSSFDNSISDEEMMKILEAKMWLIKKKLATTVKLKYLPKIRFVLDRHRERIYAIEELIKQIQLEDKKLDVEELNDSNSQD